MRTTILVITTIVAVHASAQSDNLLRNPSFEGIPGLLGIEQHENFPKGWFDCGQFPNESPPEIHSVSTQLYAVRHEPMDGNTYVSLVVRERGSWECIGQKLDQPLEAGEKYLFELYASQSETFLSPTDTDIDPVPFMVPVILRLWGSGKNKEKKVFLGKTNSIKHHDWQKYSFSFEVQEEMEYIFIEAYYSTPTEYPYAGHVLIDKASLARFE